MERICPLLDEKNVKKAAQTRTELSNHLSLSKVLSHVFRHGYAENVIS
jgi:hypothetical protein